MQPFSKHTGLVLPVDRVNVDTDQMVPKQYLKLQDKLGLGRVLFSDWRYLPGNKPNPEFIMNWPRYNGASIMLARANFGCGSSREHAPWAVADYGLRVLIAPSFADIFYNNCLKNGILPVTLPESQMDELFKRAEAQEGYSLTVDLPNQTITDSSGLELQVRNRRIPKASTARRSGRYRPVAQARGRNHRVRDRQASKRHDVRSRGLEIFTKALMGGIYPPPFLLRESVSLWQNH